VDWKRRGEEAVREIEAWRTCDKKRYETRESAQHAIEKVRWYYHAKQREYYCDKCDGYHLTTVRLHKKAKRGKHDSNTRNKC
jgi:hypothetical protein